MNEDLSLFLNAHVSQVEERIVVGRDDLPLLGHSYLSETHPPLEYVTSARAIVLREDMVLTIRDPRQVHITPGGRREPGESLLETVRREVLEETGWTLGPVTPLGFRHFHHLKPKLDGYPYPHPDFFDVLYAASAHEFQPEAREVDGWELEAGFRPVRELLTAGLTPSERLFLRAAWNHLRATPLAEERGEV